MNSTETLATTSGRPPEPLSSDYIEIGYLTCLFLIGAPLNLAAYAELREQHPRGLLGRIHLLKRHLNYSDLLILLVYVPTQVCWLISYDWRGGTFLCKLLRLFQNLCFQVSSNIIVCIALDRLISVMTPFGWCRRQFNRISKKCVPVMLLVAWLVAAILSLPQVFLWTVYEPFPNWEQCLSVWKIQEALLVSKNVTINIALSERFYMGFHLLSIFWIPFGMTTLSYLIVACWIIHNSRAKANLNRKPPYARAVRILSFAIVRMISADDGAGDLQGSSSTTENLHNSDSLQISTAFSSRTLNSSARQDSSATPARTTPGRMAIGKRARVKRKVVRISFMLVCAYVSCWLPYQSMGVWRFFDEESYKKYGARWDFLEGLVVLNAVINPFFYGMFGKMRK